MVDDFLRTNAESFVEPAERDALQAAVELLYGCEAVFAADETVTLSSSGQLHLSRDVATFRLTNHPSATVCYAWSEATHTQLKVHHRVVMQGGPVKSPGDALRASVLSELRDVREELAR